MSEIKPCRICRKAPIVSGDWATCYGDHYVVDHTMIQLKKHHWNALMSDTPSLLRGARIGLEMAKHALAEVPQPFDRLSAYKAIRAITDADIMKEISRE